MEDQKQLVLKRNRLFLQVDVDGVVRELGHGHPPTLQRDGHRQHLHAAPGQDLVLLVGDWLEVTRTDPYKTTP